MKNLSCFQRTAFLLFVICTQVLFSRTSNSPTISGLGHKSAYQAGLVTQKTALRAAQTSSGVTPFVTPSYEASDNWAGYFIGSGSGNGFKTVQGNWNVQCFSGSQSDSTQETTWVGLGGWFSGEGLVQAGTWKFPNGNVYLWWEAFNANDSGPNNGNPVFDTVNIPCGQSIHAQVAYHPSGCSSGFTMQVQDTTNGHSFSSGCQNLTGGHESADWIDERPDCGRGYNYTSLADFNYTSWSNVLAQTNISGAGWANPNNFTNTQLLMYDNGPTGNGSLNYLAYPDGLSVSSSNTFTDRWYNYGDSWGSCAA